MKPVTQKGKNVTQFEELLRTEFESKLEALRKRRSAAQTSLFDTKAGGELGLD